MEEFIHIKQGLEKTLLNENLFSKKIEVKESKKNLFCLKFGKAKR